MTSFKTPVLLLVFNRPDLTEQLIKSLEPVKPETIFVVADGPRVNHPKDKHKCREVRDLFNNLSWSCNVETLFRDTNLGCARSVSAGITWFFESNEEGIILEDDCIADPSFFAFCETLLRKYKSNSKIYHISGNNFQDGKIRGNADYYFSIFNHVWGWATWKRAWAKFEFDIQLDNLSAMEGFVNSKLILNYFTKQFRSVSQGEIDSWAFRWTFACWENKGLSILPNKNLVKNIGFRSDATHTQQIDSPQNSLPTYTMDSNLKHPQTMTINKRADLYSFRKNFQPKKKLRYYLGIAKRKIINNM